MSPQRQLTWPEIRMSMENDLLAAKTVMYAMLAFFLSGSAIAAYIISIILMIYLIIIICLLLLVRDNN